MDRAGAKDAVRCRQVCRWRACRLLWQLWGLSSLLLTSLGDRSGGTFLVESPWGALRNHLAFSKLTPNLSFYFLLCSAAGHGWERAPAQENRSASRWDKTYPLSHVDDWEIKMVTGCLGDTERRQRPKTVFLKSKGNL